MAPSTPPKSLGGASSRSRPPRFMSGSEKRLEKSRDQPSSAVHSGTWALKTSSETSQLRLPRRKKTACR